jgi:solute carrier family 25, member 39/40
MLSWEAVLWRDVPYGGLQIALYEFGRQYVMTHPDFPLLRPGLAADVVVGSFAGMIAAILTTPADVLVTRLSVQNPQSYLETRRYMSVWSTVQRIVNDEGIGGLFAGYLQRGIYYAPLIGLFFSLYEVTTHAVSNPHEIIVLLMAWQSNIAQYIHNTAHASSHVLDHVVPALVRLAATAPY